MRGEGKRLIKWHFRWTRKSKYGHIVTADKVSVCVCPRKMSQICLAPDTETHRLVDSGTDKLC